MCLPSCSSCNSFIRIYLISYFFLSEFLLFISIQEYITNHSTKKT